MKISIVIATMNRAEKLNQALSAIVELDCPSHVDYEVVVVDNGSTDNTLQICASWRQHMGERLQFCSEPRRGANWARNTGISRARGELVAMIDEDMIPARNWLQVIAGEFEAQPGLWAISGRVELKNAGDLPVSVRRQTQRQTLSSVDDTVHLLIGCNFVFRREMIDRIGWYDVDFGPGARYAAADDCEVFYRAWRAGLRMDYVPELFIYHDHGRQSEAARLKLARTYIFARGAYYGKHIGDIDILKSIYYEIRAWLGKARQGKVSEAVRGLWWLFHGLFDCLFRRLMHSLHVQRLRTFEPTRNEMFQRSSQPSQA